MDVIVKAGGTYHNDSGTLMRLLSGWLANYGCGGLANGRLARKAPIGPKRALSGQFLLFPRGCEVWRDWSRLGPKRPR